MTGKLDLSHLHDQYEWAMKTFGPGERLKPLLKHARKEIDEIEKAPKDLSEWVDALMILTDGAMRQGFTPEQIADGWVAKLWQNEHSRQWPDWRTANPEEPIEHVPDSWEGFNVRTGMQLGQRVTSQPPIHWRKPKRGETVAPSPHHVTFEKHYVLAPFEPSPFDWWITAAMIVGGTGGIGLIIKALGFI